MKNQTIQNQLQRNKAVKKLIALKVAEKLDIYEDEVRLVIDAVLDTIKEELEVGNEVVLRGFGTFYTRRTSPKVSPFIKDGAKTKPATKIDFRPALSLKEKFKDLDIGK